MNGLSLADIGGCPACGNPGKQPGADGFCPRCARYVRVVREKTWNSPGLYHRAWYSYDGAPARALRRIKRRKNGEILAFFVKRLAQLATEDEQMRTAEVVVPVPKTDAGAYHLAEMLARKTAETLELPFYAEALARRPNVRRQTLCNGRMDRIRNAGHAFRRGPEGDLTGKRVLLVDDICTTGATLCVCAGILRRAGASDVFGLTVARREKGPSFLKSPVQNTASVPESWEISETLKKRAVRRRKARMRRRWFQSFLFGSRRG